MYLHVVEHPPVPLPPPLARPPAAPEAHQHHVPITPLGADHAKVPHIFPRLLADEPQEVRRRQVAGHGQDAQRRAVLVREARRLGVSVGALVRRALGVPRPVVRGRRAPVLRLGGGQRRVVQARRGVAVAVQAHDAPAERSVVAVGGLEAALERGPAGAGGGAEARAQRRFGLRAGARGRARGGRGGTGVRVRRGG